MTNLIIVESPTKARTLGRFLGSEWVVDSTMGHIRDLPKSKIGVDVEKDFKPEYVDSPGKKETVDRLKKEVTKADKIFLATDPDREGEAISWHAYEALKLPKSKTQRVTFHEITEAAVREALEHPRAINMQLVDAQQARRILDRLVGYKLSPLLWKKIRRGLSAGRVQSVTVRLIVEKEREIEAFKSVEYWDIFCVCHPEGTPRSGQSEGSQNDTLNVKLIRIGEERAVVSNKEQADKIVADLNKAEYKVASLERREVIRRPYSPFTTSTMTQAAASNFSWSAKKTMSVAQKLYEEGAITYHRTDSTNLGVAAIETARAFIEKEYGKDFVPEKPRVYKTSTKMAQEAHEAIRPTNVSSQLSVVSSELGNDGKKLYELIWKRFLSCQMADAVFDETRIEVMARGTWQVDKDNTSTSYTLRASGQIMKFEGWRKLYKQAASADEEPQLPEVTEGEVLQLIKVDALQKFTEPPARFTEASLVKTLEKLGIGRPSTYAPTISTIQDRQYVEKNEGKFSPSSLGIAVNDFLVEYFPNVVDYNFTAGMEADLDNIAHGKKELVPVIRAFWDPFAKKLEGVEDRAKRVKIEVENTGKKCPECKVGDEVIRVGKFGKFLSCSRFPDCKYTSNFVETTNIKCPGCGEGEVIIKKTRRGKKFFGCSAYPKCKWASWKKPETTAVETPAPVLPNAS